MDGMHWLPTPYSYSSAVVAGEFAFLGLHRGYGEDFQAQLEDTFRQLSATLDSLGVDLGHLVKVNVWLKQVSDLPAMEKAFARFFPKDQFPARMTATTGFIDADCLLMIDGVASMQGSRGVLSLREVADADLDIFFSQQLDPEANRMAAFTAKNPSDREAFLAHWAKICADPGITIRSILFEGRVAGYVLNHGWFGDPEITYWLGKEFWGKGVATRALAAFLRVQRLRPLYARAAKDNLASIRVLEKCGFTRCGKDKGFSNARGEEVEEAILVLR